jgi:DNA polymerase I
VEINPELVMQKRQQAYREEHAAEQKLYQMFGSSDINLDADKQVAKWLYDDLGLKPASYTPTGQPQVNEFNLTSNPHPVTRLFNTRNKRHKTGEFLDSYLKLMDADLRIHPTINTLQARTHRFSLSDPNLQQIPTRNDRFGVREVFTAGYKGVDGWYIGADYDKQELKIAAEEARDYRLLKPLNEGLDVYVQMASAMLAKAPELVTPSERQAAKIAVLSMIYGAGAPKVAESFTVNTGRPYTVEMAKGIRSNFYETYPNLRLLMNRMQEQARYNGYITNRWERKLYVEKERAYVATDYLVQSSGRDVMVDALFNAQSILPAVGGHLLWPIHDEVLAWVPEEPSPAFLAQFGEAMVSHKFSQPLTAKPKYGKTLAELH